MSEMKEGDWLCPSASCGNINWARRDECNKCGSRRPYNPNRKVSGSERAQDRALGLDTGRKFVGGGTAGDNGGASGDWKCPDLSCGNLNYARRFECNKCGAKRPESNKWDARGGDMKGVPQAQGSDWPCPMCGNINWARRESCNICNMKRPGLSEEKREGSAGGFKEFDDREERERKRRKEEEEHEAKKRKETGARCKFCKRFKCIC